jgi:hypothetical protein
MMELTEDGKEVLSFAKKIESIFRQNAVQVFDELWRG